MARTWEPKRFNAIYNKFVCDEALSFGGAAYHRRYRSRYKECARQLAAIAPPKPADVLEVGGGQLALMCKKLWEDRASAADLPGPHLDYVAQHGVATFEWNICRSGPPAGAAFDFIFFSEVIEHLPMPGHIALERLRLALRPGGALICTTPNVYRLRNLAFLALGHRIWDHFRYPEEDVALGHVIEYSREHLQWQFAKAGLTRTRVEMRQFHHSPTNPLHRPVALLGYPLRLVPHWRDYLLAVAYAPDREK